MGSRSAAQAIAVVAPVEREAASLGWPAVCALAALAAAIPLWTGRFLPFQDAPQHLAAIRVLADYDVPAFAFRRWFEIDLLRSPYLGFYLPCAAIARIAGPEVACRIALSVIAFALPAAAWTFLRSFDRDPRLAVFAPALFHSAPLHLGFFNFVASVPATIFVVALVERELRRPSGTRAVALATASAALLYLHPSALALAIGAAGFLALTAGTGMRRAARAIAPFGPAVALLVWWMATGLFAQPQGVAGRPGISWQPLRERALDVLRFGNVLAGHADEAFVAALLVCWIAAVAVSGAPRERRWWRLPALASALAAVYLALPETVDAAGALHLRVLPLLVFVGLSSPALSARRGTTALLCLAVALQVVYGAKLAAVQRAFEAEAEAPQLEQVLRAAEPGRRILSLVWQRQSALVQFQAYQHFGMYYQVERGGRARLNFAELPWTPVRFRGAAVPLPRGWEEHPELFDARREGVEADYLLVRGPAPDPPPPFALALRRGRWALYERR